MGVLERAAREMISGKSDEQGGMETWRCISRGGSARGTSFLARVTETQGYQVPKRRIPCHASPAVE